MHKLELLELLARIPGNPEIVVWQNATVEKIVAGCDGAIEQVIECDSIDGGRVVVLGMDIPARELPGQTEVWGK